MAKKEKNDEESKKKLEKQKQNNKEEKKKNGEKPKKKLNKQKDKKVLIKKFAFYILIVISIVEIVYAGFILFEHYKRKFKSIDIEMGYDGTLTLENFVKDKKYINNSKLISNLEGIDYMNVGEYTVVLSHDNREEKVNLKIVDTTPPKVEFQDITKYIDYIPNAEDFIVSKEDLSEMTVELSNIPEINEFKEYNVNVLVKDSQGNVTSKICKLSIKWIKDEFTMEKGHTLTKEDLLYGLEQDADLIDNSKLEEITNSEIGEYEIITNKNGIEKRTTIKVTDLTPPDLILRDVSIYDDEKVSGKNAFITSVTDASGEVTTTMKTEINYSKLGAQEIVIEAVDKYGNKIEKTATLTIRKDTVGPVISGLSAITVNKGATIDYNRNVSARDVKDGPCTFEVNSTSVNTSVAGTYYAVYTSKDTKGNKTTSKRKVTVRHDQADVNALVNSIASRLSNNVEEIRDYCRNNIKYSSSYGDGDEIWYGFNNWNGNCLVHAKCFEALLRAKGYETQLIWVTNYTHYWNLVKLNGVWRHMDSTPDRNHRKISIMTDSQRLSTLSGRDWDHSNWPAAN